MARSIQGLILFLIKMLTLIRSICSSPCNPWHLQLPCARWKKQRWCSGSEARQHSPACTPKCKFAPSKPAAQHVCVSELQKGTVPACAALPVMPGVTQGSVSFKMNPQKRSTLPLRPNTAARWRTGAKVLSCFICSCCCRSHATIRSHLHW